MASVKIVLRQKKNKDGSFPLAIRITKDRKTSFIHLGQHISAHEWDGVAQRVKKSHPNSARLNNFLVAKLGEAMDTSLDLEKNGSRVSSKEVKQKIKPTGGAGFFEQADLYIKNLKALGKHNQYSANKPRIARFREFIKNDALTFTEITVPVLERFKTYLKINRKKKVAKTNASKPISERTVVNHLAVIRSVFAFAVKSGVIEKSASPFGSDKIVIKFPQSMKIGLTTDEVKKLEDVTLPQSHLNHARNIWLLSFYFAGMRISDVMRLKWSDFQNDRLYYAMGKNEKGGSLKIPSKALAILDQYKRDNPIHDFVFPDLEGVKDPSNGFMMQRQIAMVTRKIDTNLKLVAELVKIDKPLTMHIARHTFGNISGDKIPIQMLQKLYRHSSVTTTIGYQANFIHKDADEALDSVIGF